MTVERYQIILESYCRSWTSLFHEKDLKNWKEFGASVAESFLLLRFDQELNFQRLVHKKVRIVS